MSFSPVGEVIGGIIIVVSTKTAQRFLIFVRDHEVELSVSIELELESRIDGGNEESNSLHCDSGYGLR